MDEDSKIQLDNKIKNDDYTLFDKVLYGGLGYGYYSLPTNIFKIILTVIFPPLGILITNIGKLNPQFPYLTTNNLLNVLTKIDEFILSFILTMLFYIPGLIYTLTKIKSKEYSYDKIDMECKINENSKSDFKDTKDDNLEEEEEFEEFEEIEDLNKLRKKLLE
tara:strand:- start:261 stop:749 length:489 start_codon:yes stop_codon:yes gene_type:complete